MKIEDLDKLRIVKDDELPILAVADNIENIRYPPMGHVVVLQKELEMAPPIFKDKIREAVVAKDNAGNKYYITPKHITGEIYVDGYYKRINVLFTGSLSDFLSKMPKVRLVDFKEVEVDSYRSVGKSIKKFPIYELVE